MLGSGAGGDEILNQPRTERRLWREGALGRHDADGNRARAATRVEVPTLERTDVRTLILQFPVLEEHFSRLLKERHPAMVEGAAAITSP